MKNLADFKKLATIGSKWEAKHHLTFAGRDENGKAIYTTKDLGVREVSIKQSNSIAFKQVKTDGTISDSWLQYPKASDCKFTNDSIEIYEGETLVLTYKQAS